MNEHVLQTLELVKHQVVALESQLAEKRRMANSLCELAGVDPIYSVETEAAAASMPSRGDEYYGQSMSVAIRMILEARKASNLGPATVSEIHGALRSGGYHFDAANDANEKKSVRICLTKNSSMFHKLPNGKFGLSKWYPKAKTKRPLLDGKNGADDIDDEVGREVMDEEFRAADVNGDEFVADEVADN